MLASGVSVGDPIRRPPSTLVATANSKSASSAARRRPSLAMAFVFRTRSARVRDRLGARLFDVARDDLEPAAVAALRQELRDRHRREAHAAELGDTQHERAQHARPARARRAQVERLGPRECARPKALSDAERDADAPEARRGRTKRARARARDEVEELAQRSAGTAAAVQRDEALTQTRTRGVPSLGGEWGSS